ncbi:(-)-germacrene D synthase [Quillaja saponaria]|uniref:(-)-germacrene D synthase n=1 Tax=Quillaja saponaria TaxID=32244 RepID=A0AAD7QHI0_QUISA|nr:(-)-germacrene D synthase [Quillaja saponaria]
MAFQNLNAAMDRPLADFSRSVWGFHFLSYSSDFMETKNEFRQHLRELREEVKTLVLAPVDNPRQKLELIDDIQHLGLSYHFESEIKNILQEMYKNPPHDNDGDLYTVALWFRLLRQQGYHIPSDIFNRFKDHDEKGEYGFKLSLGVDVPGMLRLFEAAHLGMHGEDILDEALTFTTLHLKSMVNHMSSSNVKEKVIHALRENACNELLLKFAKLDFNAVQELHKEELKCYTEWWQKSNFIKKLPFARERAAESYFWAATGNFAPQHALARYMVAKLIALLTIVDDTYDAYGTFEELKLFTEAIQRWDASCLDHLPQCMKVVYKEVILETFLEFESITTKDKTSYVMQYIKKDFQRLARAYLKEAEWCHQDYVPSYNEYMEVASVTACQEIINTICFLGMGNIANKEVFDWVMSYPKSICASNVIGRLMGDIGSHKFEQKRKHVASAVECYMKQYGVTEEEAVEKLEEQVRNRWKDINEDFLMKQDVVPMVAVDFTRLLNVMYGDRSDKFTEGELLKNYVVLLFVNPIPIEA